jgi:hypothetical protein
MNKEKGFIRIIIILIIIGVIMTFLGFNPLKLWDYVILPVVEFIWGIIVWFVDFVVGLLRNAGSSFDKLLNILNINH